MKTKLPPFAAFVMASLVSIPLNAWASPQVGTLTVVDGDVKIFTHPSKTLPTAEGNKAPRVLYEGEYYFAEEAKQGVKVEQGNIVRTAPGAKARVVYDNGDQFNVGPASALRVFWDKDSGKGSTRVELAYGKLRGVVEKGGPRSRLQIRTSTATMGVRGTDFFIGTGNGSEQGTEVSIIRGAVEVKGLAPKSKPVEVKSGFSAEIVAPPVVAKGGEAKNGKETAAAETKAVPAPIEIRQTTQEDLHAIQKASTPSEAATTKAQAVQESAPEIAKLELKATETALKDIKTYDPGLFKQMQEAKVATADQINTQAIQVLAKDAPKAPEKRKPYKSEIEDLENGAYEKYFKAVQ